MKASNLLYISIGMVLSLTLLVGGQYFKAWAEGDTEYKEIVLKVDGLGCVTCEWDIEGKLNELAGVKEADVTSKKVTWWNPFSAREGKAFITYDTSAVTVNQLIETIEKSSDAVYTYTASILRE